MGSVSSIRFVFRLIGSVYSSSRAVECDIADLPPQNRCGEQRPRIHSRPQLQQRIPNGELWHGASDDK